MPDLDRFRVGNRDGYATQRRVRPAVPRLWTPTDIANRGHPPTARIVDTHQQRAIGRLRGDWGHPPTAVGPPPRRTPGPDRCLSTIPADRRRRHASGDVGGCPRFGRPRSMPVHDSGPTIPADDSGGSPPTSRQRRCWWVSAIRTRDVGGCPRFEIRTASGAPPRPRRPRTPPGHPRSPPVAGR